MQLDSVVIKEALPKLTSYAKRLYYNPAKADDLVGATLLRAWNKRHLLKEGNKPHLWLKGIMYSIYCNQLKSDALRHTISPIVVLGDEHYSVSTKPNQEDSVLCKELIEIIKTKSCAEAALELGCCKATAWHRRNWLKEESCI
jgi:DNA-directed RNA polymerase specialized sigma24 family protein